MVNRIGHLSNRSLVTLLEHLVRVFTRAVRITDGDAAGAEARGGGRAFAFGLVFEVQVAHGFKERGRESWRALP